jgi:hypothetical protein
VTGYQIPEFQNYIDTFIENSSFLSVGNYSFPEESASGYNILAFTGDTTSIDTAGTYSMTFITDNNSQITLSVQLFFIEGNGKWVMGNVENWTIAGNTSEYLHCQSNYQENIVADLALEFEGQGIASLYVSIENPYIFISQEKFIRWGD